MAKQTKTWKSIAAVRHGIARKAQFVLAPAVWLYIGTKLICSDFDDFATQHLGGVTAWIVTHRLTCIAGLGVCLGLLQGAGGFAITMLYILCFPPIFLFYHFPLWLLRQWKSLLLLVPFTVRLAESPTFFLLGVGLLAVCSGVIIANLSSVATQLSMAILGIVLTGQYIRILIQHWDAGHPHLMHFLSEVFAVSELQSSETTKHRIGSHLSERMEVETSDESRFVVLVYSLSVLFTLAATVLVFALEYYGLFSLDGTNYSSSLHHGFGFFIIYALRALVTSTIPGLTPMSTAAKALPILQRFCALTLLMMLASHFWRLNENPRMPERVHVARRKRMS